MKKIVLLTALAASLAAPAFADTAFAIRHFNQDADSIGDLRMVPDADASVVVSTNRRSTLATAFGVLNVGADTPAELRGVTGATVITGGHSAEAAAIFAQLRAESLEND